MNLDPNDPGKGSGHRPPYHGGNPPPGFNPAQSVPSTTTGLYINLSQQSTARPQTSQAYGQQPGLLQTSAQPMNQQNQPLYYRRDSVEQQHHIPIYGQQQTSMPHYGMQAQQSAQGIRQLSPTMPGQIPLREMETPQQVSAFWQNSRELGHDRARNLALAFHYNPPPDYTNPWLHGSQQRVDPRLETPATRVMQEQLKQLTQNVQILTQQLAESTSAMQSPQPSEHSQAGSSRSSIPGFSPVQQSAPKHAINLEQYRARSSNQQNIQRTPSVQSLSDDSRTQSKRTMPAKVSRQAPPRKTSEEKLHEPPTRRAEAPTPPQQTEETYPSLPKRKSEETPSAQADNNGFIPVASKRQAKDAARQATPFIRPIDPPAARQRPQQQPAQPAEPRRLSVLDIARLPSSQLRRIKRKIPKDEFHNGLDSLVGGRAGYYEFWDHWGFGDDSPQSFAMRKYIQQQIGRMICRPYLLRAFPPVPRRENAGLFRQFHHPNGEQYKGTAEDLRSIWVPRHMRLIMEMLQHMAVFITVTFQQDQAEFEYQAWDFTRDLIDITYNIALYVRSGLLKKPCNKNVWFQSTKTNQAKYCVRSVVPEHTAEYIRGIIATLVEFITQDRITDDAKETAAQRVYSIIHQMYEDIPSPKAKDTLPESSRLRDLDAFIRNPLAIAPENQPTPYQRRTAVNHNRPGNPPSEVPSTSRDNNVRRGIDGIQNYHTRGMEPEDYTQQLRFQQPVAAVHMPPAWPLQQEQPNPLPTADEYLEEYENYLRHSNYAEYQEYLRSSRTRERRPQTPTRQHDGSESDESAAEGTVMSRRKREEAYAYFQAHLDQVQRLREDVLIPYFGQVREAQLRARSAWKDKSNPITGAKDGNTSSTTQELPQEDQTPVRMVKQPLRSSVVDNYYTENRRPPPRLVISDPYNGDEDIEVAILGSESLTRSDIDPIVQLQYNCVERLFHRPGTDYAFTVNTLWEMLRDQFPNTFLILMIHHGIKLPVHIADEISKDEYENLPSEGMVPLDQWRIDELDHERFVYGSESLDIGELQLRYGMHEAAQLNDILAQQHEHQKSQSGQQRSPPKQSQPSDSASPGRPRTREAQPAYDMPADLTRSPRRPPPSAEEIQKSAFTPKQNKGGSQPPTFSPEPTDDDDSVIIEQSSVLSPNTEGVIDATATLQLDCEEDMEFEHLVPDGEPVDIPREEEEALLRVEDHEIELASLKKSQTSSDKDPLTPDPQQSHQVTQQREEPIPPAPQQGEEPIPPAPQPEVQPVAQQQQQAPQQEQAPRPQRQPARGRGTSRGTPSPKPSVGKQKKHKK